jgi:tetratricopeptide (TPR) repeat protein
MGEERPCGKKGHGGRRPWEKKGHGAWLISFERIQQLDPLAAEYLSFMCCIDPRDIPQSLLPAAQSRKKETDAIGTLSAYSFVKRSADNSLDLHRLVHLATRNWLRREESLAQWTLKAVTRVDEVFPDDDHKNRSVWRAYLPHARYVLDSTLIEDGVKEKQELLWKFGMCLYREGRYNEAEKSSFQVMETRKRVLGVEHPDTLTSMANLASTYGNQGRWKEAEELFIQVMETRKRVLGLEWKEALELEAQMMETSKRVLGEEHRELVIASRPSIRQTNLARLGFRLHRKRAITSIGHK